MYRNKKLPPFRLLIADDIPMQVHMLENFIGHQYPDALIYTAKSGNEVLNIVTKQEIDLILSDIRMPQLDGLEMLRKVRRLSENTLVVFITAYPLFEYAQDAIKNGAIDFVVKPVDYEELKTKLALWEKRSFHEKEERFFHKHQQEMCVLHQWLSVGFERLKPNKKLLINQLLHSGWFLCGAASTNHNPADVSALFSKKN